jgi:hypothetical protein
MWVTNDNTNVTKLSLSGAPSDTFTVGANLVGLAFDGTDMWVVGEGNYNVIKLSPSGAMLGSFSAGSGAAGIAFDGTYMWITNDQVGNTVTEL